MCHFDIVRFGCGCPGRIDGPLFPLCPYKRKDDLYKDLYEHSRWPPLACKNTYSHVLQERCPAHIEADKEKRIVRDSGNPNDGRKPWPPFCGG